MLNSLLRGPVEQLAKSRDTYVKACEKAGRSAVEIASLLGRWACRATSTSRQRMPRRWPRPRRRRRAAFSHPRADRSRVPAAAAGVPGDGGAIRAGLVGALVAESVAFGSPDIVAARVDELRRLGGRRNALLDELRRSASGARAA